MSVKLVLLHGNVVGVLRFARALLHRSDVRLLFADDLLLIRRASRVVFGALADLALDLGDTVFVDLLVGS